jgi:hypothetical protein
MTAMPRREGLLFIASTSAMQAIRCVTMSQKSAMNRNHLTSQKFRGGSGSGWAQVGLRSGSGQASYLSLGLWGLEK